MYTEPGTISCFIPQKFSFLFLPSFETNSILYVMAQQPQFLINLNVCVKVLFEKST